MVEKATYLSKSTKVNKAPQETTLEDLKSGASKSELKQIKTWRCESSGRTG